MNYTELNEDQKYDVMDFILDDCEDLRWDEIGVDELSDKYDFLMMNLINMLSNYEQRSL